MDPPNRGFMHMLSQGSQSQTSGNGSQNSTSPQFPSIFSQSQFSQSSTPTFQNFHPFGAPTNYQPYGNSTPSFHAASTLVTLYTSEFSRFSSSGKLGVLT
uniref:Uncharacterized protein n=1 Tax=Oryza glumipatula TaxID=40148 RepID=A0A0D9ZGL8_9ORYZ